MERNFILHQFLAAHTRQLRAGLLANMPPHFLGLYRTIIEMQLIKFDDQDMIAFLQAHSAFMQATGDNLAQAFETRQKAAAHLVQIANGEDV